MILSPHNEERVLATLADVVINGESVLAGVLHLDFFARSLRVVQPDEQNAVT